MPTAGAFATAKTTVLNDNNTNNMREQINKTKSCDSIKNGMLKCQTTY